MFIYRALPFKVVWLIIILISLLLFLTQTAVPQEVAPFSSKIRTELSYRPDLNTTAESQSAAEPTAPTPFIPWTRIATQSVRDGNWEIYVSADDGTNATRVTEDTAADVHPRLSSGSDRVAFASNRDGDYEIFVVNTDGSDLIQLTDNDTDDVYPAWSFDEDLIAFQAYRDGQPEIYVMNADGSNQTRLTYHPNFDGQPVWSPQGTKIAFSSQRNGALSIFVMNPDGSDVRRLSENSNATDPTWSPDGRWIAFSGGQHHGNGEFGAPFDIWTIEVNEDGVGIGYERNLRLYGLTETYLRWPTGWSPDSRWLTVTRLSLVYFQGEYYWTKAEMQAIDPEGLHDHIIPLSASREDWSPDWQLNDTQPPSAEISPLPATSSSPISLSWSGEDEGVAGLRSFEVEVWRGNDPTWRPWLPDTPFTSGWFPGQGGQTYAFRVRARDNVFNYSNWLTTRTTMVEDQPPIATVSPLPPYSPAGEILLSWGGTDPGNSGVATYDVQYTTGGGDWTLLESGTTARRGVLQAGNPGDVYSFRVRATDHAGNVGNWSPVSSAARTTLYNWKISGSATDNTGVPIHGLDIALTPEAAKTENEPAGRYVAYSVQPNDDTYEISWGKNSYSSLPITTFDGNQDQQVNVILPSENNIVANWGFENMAADWATAGVPQPLFINNASHTGQFAVLSGPTSLFSTSPFAQTALEANHPSIAWDSSGQTHVVFVAQTSAPPIRRAVFYTYRAPDGTWSPRRNLSGDDEPSGAPQMILNSDTLHIFWKSVEGKYFYARRDSTEHWINPQPVGVIPGEAKFQSIAVGPNGTVYLLWIGRTPTGENDELFYAERRSTMNTFSMQRVSEAERNHFSVQEATLTTDLDNRAYIVWQEDSEPSWGNTTRLLYTTSHHLDRRQSETLWEEERTNPEHLQIVTDSGGRPHVFWTETDVLNGQTSLHHSGRMDDQWSADIVIGQVDPLAGESPFSVGRDFQGKIHIAWLHPGNDSSFGRDVYYRYLGNNDNWSRIQTLHENVRADRIEQFNLRATHNRVLVSWLDEQLNFTFKSLQEPNGRWSTTASISSLTAFDQLRFVFDHTGRLHAVGHDQSPSGGLIYATSSLATQTADSLLSQTLTIPADMDAPTLSFVYQIHHAAVSYDDKLVVEIDDGSNITPIFSTSEATGKWEHTWLSLSRWKGKAITITFRVPFKNEQPASQVLIDEVSIGSAHPDVWLDGSASAAWPGEPVVYRLNYGNQGGTGSRAGVLTFTLPAEVSFVSASIPPLSTNPLTWSIDSLPAKSDAYTIEVTGMVSSSAATSGVLVGTAAITTTGELETQNNTVEINAPIGQFNYLPFAVRP